LASIDESIVRGDFESARRDAHAMKGRVGLLGLPQIYELVSALESAAATGEANRQMVQTLMRVGISLREQILSVLQPLDAPQSTGPCVAPVGAMPESIKAIIEMLVANDGGTAAQIERCLRASELSEWHPVLKTALQKVRAFDFDGALHCLGTPEATAGCAR
jgi:chemotaxis protein histidine kinase CheA